MKWKSLWSEEQRKLESQGLTDAEIAEHFDVKVSTVRDRRKREKRRKLRQGDPIWKARSQTSDRQRELEELGLTDAEIAKRLCVTIDAVRIRRHREQRRKLSPIKAVLVCRSPHLT